MHICKAHIKIFNHFSAKMSTSSSRGLILVLEYDVYKEITFFKGKLDQVLLNMYSAFTKKCW